MTDPGDRSFPPRQGYGAPQGYGPPQEWQPPQQGYGPPPGYGYYQDDRPPRRRRHRGLKIFASIVGGLVVLIIIGAALGGGKSKTPTLAANMATNSAAPAAPPSAAAHHRQTITYVVIGSAADVTYGPTGTDRKGHVPMRVTHRLGNPQFYSITAQLSGGGRVRCKILIDGKAISTAAATGSYNIASCEISKDPLSGKWSDSNSG